MVGQTVAMNSGVKQVRQLKERLLEQLGGRAAARELLFVLLGLGMLWVALGGEVSAQTAGTTHYNDIRISQAANAVLTYLEGSFGALVMVAAGLGAIISSAFGQYRAALSLLVVSVGAFILRSLISTFFNDTNLQ